MEQDIAPRLAAILVLGIASQWIAWRFRIPAILLLLASGLAAGPGFNYLDPDELLGDLLIPVVSLAVAIILFEGGLTLKLTEFREIGGVLRRLLSVGVAVTWLIAALAAWLLFDMDLRIAALLGAMLTVTGPTVIGPLLDHVRPVGKVRPILKWEGIAVDPIGAALTVLTFEAINAPEVGRVALDAAEGVIATAGIGVGLGIVGAVLVVLPIRRFWIADNLHAPVTLMVLIAVHTLSNEIRDESGLLTATVMGFALANQRSAAIAHIIEFKENLRVILIAGVFVLLAARLDRSDISAIGWQGAVFLLVLVGVARPLSVMASTFGSELSGRERWFLALVAPRGVVAAAVSSIFALQLAGSSYDGADRLVPITFAAIIGTIVFYGLLAGPIAKRLALADANPQGLLFIGAQPWVRNLAAVLRRAGVHVVLVDSNWRNVTDARAAGLTAYYGSALSERAIEDVDLAGVGRMLAVTSNDGVNALAARRFMPIFGRASVYQLSPTRRGGDEAIAGELRGRALFDELMTHDEIERRVAAGEAFKATPLTEQFTLDNYYEQYGPDAGILFLTAPGGKLSVQSVDIGFRPSPGQTVIGLVRDVPRARDAGEG